MKNNYDFLGFMNYQQGYIEETSKPATQAQIKYYQDLCKQENIIASTYRKF